MRIFINMEPNI